MLIPPGIYVGYNYTIRRVISDPGNKGLETPFLFSTILENPKN